MKSTLARYENLWLAYAQGQAVVVQVSRAGHWWTKADQLGP